jgi:two-component system LytT family response regulator
LEQITHHRPELIFLDVEMPGMNGFQMLESVKLLDFDIIFTTAFDQYAIRAIRFGALDFLVKPIDKDELRHAVDSYVQRPAKDTLKQLNALYSQLDRKKDISGRKIAFPSLHGFELVPLEDIMVCEASSNYTKVHLKNGQHILVSRTLKDIAELLNMSPFFRLHHSYLVNLQCATQYIRGEGGQLVLHGNLTVPVSRNKKDELISLLTNLST